MKNSIRQVIDKNGIMVIDGSMSTALEQLGANLNSKLWTARALADSPELVRQVHLDYFNRSELRDHLQLSGDDSGLMANGYTQAEAEHPDRPLG